MRKQYHSPIVLKSHKASKSTPHLAYEDTFSLTPRQKPAPLVHPTSLQSPSYHPEYHRKGTFYAIKKTPVDPPASPPPPNYYLRYSHFDPSVTLKPSKQPLKRLRASHFSGPLRVIPTVSGSSPSHLVSFQFYSPTISKPVSPPSASFHDSRITNQSSHHASLKAFDQLSDLPQAISLISRLDAAQELGLTRHRSPENGYVRLSRTARLKKNRLAL